MHNEFLAVVFALASALTIAWGTVVRHRIVALPEDAGSSPLRTALRSPLWWITLFSAFAAYGLQVVALGFGTLLVVQPILVLSLMFTLVLAAYFERRRMEIAEIVWATALTAGVMILVLRGRPLPGAEPPDDTRWWVAVAVGTLAGVIAVAAARGRGPVTRSLILGALCGAIFGYVALLSKTVADQFVADHWVGVVSQWHVYALTVVAMAGTAVQQYAFAAGPLNKSLPSMKVFELVVAFALGYAVLGEQFQVTTALGWITMGAALVTMFVATYALASKQVDEPRPTEYKVP